MWWFSSCIHESYLDVILFFSFRGTLFLLSCVTPAGCPLSLPCCTFAYSSAWYLLNFAFLGYSIFVSMILHPTLLSLLTMNESNHWFVCRWFCLIWQHAFLFLCILFVCSCAHVLSCREVRMDQAQHPTVMQNVAGQLLRSSFSQDVQRYDRSFRRPALYQRRVAYGNYSNAAL